MTTFPDVKSITSSLYCTASSPRQQEDLIAFSRIWLVYLAADWQVVVSTQRVWEPTLCAHVYQKVVWRLISCSRPCLCCLKIPNTFLLAKRKSRKAFGVTFEYQVPRGFTVYFITIFSRARAQFNIIQRTTNLQFTAIVCVVSAVAKHHMAFEWKELRFQLVSEVRELSLQPSSTKKGPPSNHKSKNGNRNCSSNLLSLFNADWIITFFTIRCTNYNFVPASSSSRSRSTGRIELPILWMWSFVLKIPQQRTRYFWFELFSPSPVE